MSGDPTTTKRITQFSHLSPQFLFLFAALIGVLLAAGLCAAGKYREAAGAALVTLLAGLAFSADVSVSTILVAWFAATPIASFFIRFPYDKSIITFNRGVFALIGVLLLIKTRTEPGSSAIASGEAGATRLARFGATPFEIAWALLAVAALVSALLTSHDIGYAGRIAIDSFWLPLFAFRLARSQVIGRAHLRWLTLGVIAVAFFLFATGAYELATGADLFAYKGSRLVRAGELRINGPFAADASYAIIALMLFLFLRAAPEALSIRFDKTSRLFYEFALAAAAIASLLPMFRTIAVALLASWLIVEWAGGKSLTVKRGSPIAGRWLIAALIAITVLAATVAPALFSRRLTDPRNALSRVATWEAACAIALEHPLFGVGLANYEDSFRARYNWEDESVEKVMDAQARSSPHSNVMWIAAELGWAMLALYLIASFFLARMGWRAFRRAQSGAQRTASACFLALLVAYWIPGLTLTSGLYSDLNLYFFFLLGLLSNRFA
jgi:hypothetical protein